MSQQAIEPRVLVNRKGKSLTTHLTDKQAFTELERLVRVGERTGFAEDLIAKGRRYGLTDEQFWWVHKLIQPENSVSIDAGNIVSCFHRALDHGVKAKHLKVPLTTVNGTAIILSYAGPRSRYHGDVWVTDDGSYPNNVLFGRVNHLNGMFIGRDVPEDVADLVEEVENNPERYLPW